MRHSFVVFFVILLSFDARAAMRELRIRVDGRDRSFLVYEPAVRHRGKWPLVVLLHGGGGGGRQAARSYGMNAIADREGFLVAYPNGTGRRTDILLTWNAGNCCGPAQDQHVDDVAFLRAMVERIDRDFSVDRTRVFATGMSNGGMMAHRLGCEAADLFAAIAPVSGALNIPCKPSDAVAVLMIHGTADQHVPFEGGVGPRSLDPRVDQPVSHAVDVWRRANACTQDSVPQRTGSVTHETWSLCRDGADVSLFTIHGGGHAWPGGLTPRRRGADTPSSALSASEEIWKFFAAHPKR
jgi:polyhydroxybutyrate depolymerase